MKVWKLRGWMKVIRAFVGDRSNATACVNGGSSERITHCGIFALSIWRHFNEIFASIMMTLASTLGWFSRVVTVTIELDGPMVADEGEGNYVLHIIIWFLVVFEAVQHRRFHTYVVIVCSELKLIIHNDMLRQLYTPQVFQCRWPSQVLR